MTGKPFRLMFNETPYLVHRDGKVYREDPKGHRLETDPRMIQKVLACVFEALRKIKEGE